MPTVTVKHVPGPARLPKIKPTRRISFKCLAEILLRKTGLPGGVQRTLFVACALLSMATMGRIEAQTVSARITVVSTSPGKVTIDARLPNETSGLSFRNSYAGILGLGERIDAVEGFRSDGEPVAVQKLTAGEFRSSEKVSRFKYEVNLAEPSRLAQMSHVSWLNPDHGLMMLGDLLPQRTDSGNLSNAVINIDLPAGWTVASNVNAIGSQFSTDDPQNAVFLVGRSLHEKRQQFNASGMSAVMSGKWPVSDSDVIKRSTEILQHYSRVTGFNPGKSAVLMLIPYAGETGPENWSAETRGNVVVLLLGRNANRRKILSRLGIVLSHEIFHLWVPNSLNFTGDYDWFFEGFTLYEALRTDLRLGFISFDDYLATLARVFDSYRSAPDSNRFSLIEDSERRWTTSSSLVYDKGMLVAFIYDLSLRNVTGCKASLDDVYAELFRLPASGQRSANETIIKVLTGQEGLNSFARDHVETASKINLDTIFSAYGIVLQPGTSRSRGTEFRVVRDLNENQRTLLRCIGYRK